MDDLLLELNVLMGNIRQMKLAPEYRKDALRTLNLAGESLARHDYINAQRRLNNAIELTGATHRDIVSSAQAALDRKTQPEADFGTVAGNLTEIASHLTGLMTFVIRKSREQELRPVHMADVAYDMREKYLEDPAISPDFRSKFLDAFHMVPELINEHKFAMANKVVSNLLNSCEAYRTEPLHETEMHTLDGFQKELTTLKNLMDKAAKKAVSIPNGQGQDTRKR